MRRKNVDIAKVAAGELVRVLMGALDEAGVKLSLDQQLIVLTRLKEAVEGGNGHAVVKDREG